MTHSALGAPIELIKNKHYTHHGSTEPRLDFLYDPNSDSSQKNDADETVQHYPEGKGYLPSLDHYETHRYQAVPMYAHGSHGQYSYGGHPMYGYPYPNNEN